MQLPATSGSATCVDRQPCTLYLAMRQVGTSRQPHQLNRRFPPLHQYVQIFAQACQALSATCSVLDDFVSSLPPRSQPSLVYRRQGSLYATRFRHGSELSFKIFQQYRSASLIVPSDLGACIVRNRHSEFGRVGMIAPLNLKFSIECAQASDFNFSFQPGTRPVSSISVCGRCTASCSTARRQ